MDLEDEGRHMRFLIRDRDRDRDRDGKYSALFDHILADAGIRLSSAASASRG